MDLHSSIHHAIINTVPQRVFEKKRPWISSYTLSLIAERAAYRDNNDFENEKSMNKAIKQQVKIDRRSYLDGLLADGKWEHIKAFKKEKIKQTFQIPLQDMDGHEIPQELQAEAMAAHLESHQWHERSGCGGHSLRRIFAEDLAIDKDIITREELQRIIRKLKNKRAPGSDAIPPEIWKAKSQDMNAIDIFVHLCNQCWVSRKIPFPSRLYR